MNRLNFVACCAEKRPVKKVINTFTTDLDRSFNIHYRVPRTFPCPIHILAKAQNCFCHVVSKVPDRHDSQCYLE